METITNLNKNDGISKEYAADLIHEFVGIAINKEQIFSKICEGAKTITEQAGLPWDEFRLYEDSFVEFMKESEGYFERESAPGPEFFYEEENITYQVFTRIIFTNETSIQCGLALNKIDGDNVYLYLPEEEEWKEENFLPDIPELSDKVKEYIKNGDKEADFAFFCSMNMRNLSDELIDAYIKKYRMLLELYAVTKDFMEFSILNQEDTITIDEVKIGLVPKNPDIYGFTVGSNDDQFVVYQYLEEVEEDGAYHLHPVGETTDMDMITRFIKEMADHYTDDTQFIIPLSLRNYTKDCDINDAGASAQIEDLTEEEKENQLAVMEFIAMLMVE